ncbi:MAG: N5-glutamine methyltransferase family protein [Mycobacteriales bacterium]
MGRKTLGALIDDAEQTFRFAEIMTSRADAEQVAAHVLGVDRHELALDSEPDEQLLARFQYLVDKRAERIPLGHLIEVAVLGGVEVSVGPGVFVPRMHSELVLASGLRAIREIPDPIVVDLCTGSGAIALALAHARPDATVHAVDFDPLALEFARRNSARRAELGDTTIVLHDADITEPGLLTELDSTVDLVLANPPFVPEETELLPEYGVHHPRQAIFSGPDGLDVIRHVVDTAARLLRPCGGVVVEHGHLHGSTVPGLLRTDAWFQDVSSHLDHDQ